MLSKQQLQIWKTLCSEMPGHATVWWWFSTSRHTSCFQDVVLFLLDLIQESYVLRYLVSKIDNAFPCLSCGLLFLSCICYLQRGSLIPFHFLPFECYPHIWGCWCFSVLSWFQFVTHPTQHFSWCTQCIHSKNSREHCCTPFSILNQSVVAYRVLTLASQTAYRFLRKQIKWSGISISLRAFHSLSWSIEHNQRLWHSHWNRGRWFCGIP